MNNEIWIYVTKYAFTKGILYVLAQYSKGLMKYTPKESHVPVYLTGRGWHYTKESAVARAEEMRTRKIASLKKQIKRIEAITW